MDVGPTFNDFIFLFQKYLPLRGGDLGWVGFDNYTRFVSSILFGHDWYNTSYSWWCFVYYSDLGILFSLLLNQPFWGQGIVNYVYCPIFVMPTVSGLVWKNMFMDPVNGFCTLIQGFWIRTNPMVKPRSILSLTIILSWQWLPFATLILLTAIQSLDSEQIEAEMDGARLLGRFWFIIIPHLARAITIVILIKLYSYSQFC